MRQHLYIWLKYPDDQGRFGADPAAAALICATSPQSIRRIVPSYEELVEKILIAEAGLDDLEVELVKLMVCIREAIDITQPFFFARLNATATTVTFAVPEGGKVRENEYPFRAVPTTREHTLSMLRALPPDQDPWPYVNRSYVLNRLAQAGLAERLS